MNSKSGSIRRWLVVGSLVAFAFALCVVGVRTQPMGKTVTVTITPGNPATASPDSVTISKSDGDQVKWVCPNCTSGFAVHFPQASPFAGKSFSSKNPQSGKVAAQAAKGTYNYTVTTNGSMSDPSVIVN